MEKTVESMDKQVLHLEARVAALEELLFETNKPTVKYAVEPLGDTLIFNFSELTPEESKKVAQTIVAQEEEKAEISEEELLLMMQSAQSQKLGFKPRI